MARRNTNYKKALFFDGSDDNLTVPVDPSASGFSMAFWYQPITYEANDRVLDWQDAGPANGFTILQNITGGQQLLRFQTHNGSVQTTNSSFGQLNAGGKYHLMIIHDGTGVTLYVNNVQAATDSTAAFVDATATMTFGKRVGGSNFFKGNIAGFVMHNGAQWTAQQRSDLFNLGIVPTGATVSYNFENSVADQTGNGNNGTLTGGFYVEFDAKRRYPTGTNRALNFDTATAAKVTVTDTAALRMETAGTFTWVGKVYITNLSENVLPRLFNKNPHFCCWMGDQTSGRANEFALEIADASGTVEYWGNTRLTHFREYDFAITFDEATGESSIYIDGEAEGVTTLLGPFDTEMDPTTGADLIIGNSSPAFNRNSGGYLRNLAQYNVVLTQAEVREIVNGGNVTRGLVAKWNASEGTGTTITDSSGNGLDGTMDSAAWQTVVLTRTTAGTRTAAGTRQAA